MPKEAIGLGAVDVVLNPEQINYTLYLLAEAHNRPSAVKKVEGGGDGAIR